MISKADDSVGGYKEDCAGVRAFCETGIVDIANLALCDELEGKIGGDDGVLRHF